MTRERKMRVTLVLGLSALSVLFTAGLKRSSDHEEVTKLQDTIVVNLKPKTPSFCDRLALSPFAQNNKLPSRSISSEEEDAQNTNETLAEICANERKLAALKADLEKIQSDRDEILALVERAKEQERKREDEKKTKEKIKVESKDEAMLLLMAHRYSMMQQRQNFISSVPQPAPLRITTAYSPFHNPSNQDLTNYMQLAMMNRMQFALNEDQYWHPEWNNQGQMTNPIYGTPQTWSNIEDMYRNPMGNSFSPSYQTEQPTFYFR